MKNTLQVQVVLTQCLAAQTRGPQAVVPEQQHLTAWQHGNADSWALPSPVESKTGICFHRSPGDCRA